MILYVVGKGLAQGTDEWEFVGVFSTRQLAEAACRNRMYFVGPAELDTDYNDYDPTHIEWPDSYIPNTKEPDDAQANNDQSNGAGDAQGKHAD